MLKFSEAWAQHLGLTPQLFWKHVWCQGDFIVNQNRFYHNSFPLIVVHASYILLCHVCLDLLYLDMLHFVGILLYLRVVYLAISCSV